MIALRSTPAVEQLPAEASWLERLVAVTGRVPRAAGRVDWVAVESRLGTPLPSDYKALVETFGDGMFDGFHGVFISDELIKTPELAARLGQAPREPHPPFPTSGGLVPWMGNEHKQSFYWITEGPDPDQWPVYVTGAEPEAGQHRALWLKADSVGGAIRVRANEKGRESVSPLPAQSELASYRARVARTRLVMRVVEQHGLRRSRQDLRVAAGPFHEGA